MKRNLFFKIAVLLLFCNLQLSTYAQGKEVTGTVTDPGNAPLPGVSIGIKGTTKGTVTNIDGNFSLQVPDENSVLIFSFIGYANKEIAVAGQTVINVSMSEDVMKLDEVVVTGYGVSKKKDLTGSLTSIKESDFKTGVISSPEQLLQGKVAGVQTTSNNGEPGSGSVVRVRGASTIMSGIQPLYVVDGIPLDMKTSSPDGPNGSALNGAPATSPLTFINPSDIESIDILKDASAAAIYGSRGANGVVIITTKKGKEGKCEVNYSASIGISQLPKKLDVLSAAKWTAYRTDTLKKPEYNFHQSTNWQDQVYRNAITQNQNLSFSGGSAKSQYRTSFNYVDQQGIIKTSEMKRFSGRLNLTQKALNDRLIFESNLTASENIERRPPVGTTGYQGDVVLNALLANPTMPVRWSNGDYADSTGSGRNPVEMLDLTSDITRTTRVLGGISAQLEIIKGLTYKINLGLDYTNANRFINQSQKLTYEQGPNNTGGSGQINNKELYNYLIEHTLNYNKTFGVHNIGLLAGYSYQEYNIHTSDMSGGGFVTDGVQYTNVLYSAPVLQTSISSSADNYKMQSFFGRLNYSLMDRYILTTTIRYDGSSKFGKNNKYGSFPSFALAWRLSEEEFIKDLNVFSNLKLRGGWGKTGNSEIPTEQSQYLYAPNSAVKAIIGGQVITGFSPYVTPNPNLKWESTSSLNGGIDYGFFKGRLSGSVDVYKKTSNNILLYVPTPQGGLTANWYENIDSCKIINKGVEFSLSAIVVDNKDFKWEITGNLSFLSNIVKGLTRNGWPTALARGQGLTGVDVQRISDNQPLNVFYGYKVDSISPNGTIIYQKGKSGADTSMYLGNPQPKYIWSITNNFSYKNFDLSIFIEGVHGNKIFNNTALLMDKTNLNQASNALSYYVDDKASFSNIPTVSDRYIEDGSYARLSNVTLGYNINLSKTNLISKIRIYVSGSNLLLLTKYKGYDPDVSSSADDNGVNSFGIDITSYPKSRTFMAGLDVTF